MAIAASAGAVLLPDPVLVLPVAWAIWNMKRHLKNWVALAIIAAAAIATVVEVVTESWVIKIE